MSKIYILLFTIIWLVFQPFENVNAALRTKVRICAVKGTVQTGNIVHNGDEMTCPLKQTMKQTECRVVNQATMVETGDDGWAQLEYFNGMTVKIEPNTKVILKRNEIFVQSGKGWFKVEPGYVDGKKVFVIYTPTAIAGIRGTEFIVNVKKDGSTNFQLIEGSVEISDKGQQSKMILVAGMEVSIPAGSSTLNTGLLNIKGNDKWWTDWPTLIPIAQMPGNNGGTTSSNATENTLFPIADSHVYAYNYSGWNKANWGKYEQLGAGWNPTGGEKRAFLKFDVSGIDFNNFEKATLKLYHIHTGGGNAVELGVYPIHGPWTEGRGTYKPASAALPGELTWNNQPKIAQYPTVYFNPGQGSNKWVEVDVTTLVKAWLEGFPNHGMVIKAGENYIGKSEAQYGFYSREFEDVDKRPQLILNGSSGNSQKLPTEQPMNPPAITEFPEISGDWEMTCIGDEIFKFKLTLVQHDNVFYGDMVRTNGNERMAKIEGQILSNNRIEFTRSVGNWKQYYTGEINQKSGSRATSFEGLFGFKDQLNYEWYAKSLIGTTSNNSVAGQWQIDQSNGFNGTMNLQNNSGRITGNAIWNGYLKGTIDGKVSGSTIEFTISYPNGDKGLYKGTITQNGTKIINGTSNANNGTSATWGASK
ncbi:MAG: DNRLRE domain-containing protein [Draconibacterium sp.]|nr:DNRLRE domain-containing protein [Draconibacterium sp.]